MNCLGSLEDYIKSNPLSQNDLAEQVNEEIRKITVNKDLTLISIPKRLFSSFKAKNNANSAIKKWYKKSADSSGRL